uniref:Hepatoma-derived growth factor-related protein 2-like n=1 Tax=Tanacetum cinerariifolium TaxID=118510 RepID=A0A699IPA0_TANCI|nr:hepatoma-derived growth factor-related protein 2-like [Tanacetum cinerariifolium]
MRCISIISAHDQGGCRTGMAKITAANGFPTRFNICDPFMRWFIEYFATIEDYGLMVYTLKSFSVKKRKKLMNKEMKEEDKLNKEADKIVKWAKQASNRRTNVSGLNLDEGLVI